MGKRKGMIYEALERFNSLMAIGESRDAVKREARKQGASLFGFSDQKIHSYETRDNYQKVVMAFLHWCHHHYTLNRLAQVDARADELASAYLRERIGEGYSAWTLHKERSALRLFFQQRDLATGVDLPARRRTQITRSRGSAQRDKNIQEANWQHVILFCLACGLRREELRDLLVCHIYYRPHDGQLVVQVVKGKGGKCREVPVFPGREQAVLSQVEGKAPEEHVFTKLGALDIHSYRRQFAQELYQLRSGRPLPPAQGRLRREDVDLEVALYVSRCLGHNRIDVIFSSYIR